MAARHRAPGDSWFARREHSGAGRSRAGPLRGGLSTKLHLACEQGQRPLSLVLSAGQAADAPHFEAVMAGIRIARPDGGRPRTRPQRVRVDKAYSSRAIRAHLRRRQIACTIPEPADHAGHRRRRGSRGGRPPSTRSTTAAGTPWSAAATASNATGWQPPGSTSSPSATWPPSTSPPSTNGSTYFETRPTGRAWARRGPDRSR
ncbi:transposase [Streptomyces sp. NPDC049837]|uniref:transposase n=1 Tax=Streptomyces sp. NPDC049837 TaxID=3155277 RepID=UPI0034321377